MDADGHELMARLIPPTLASAIRVCMGVALLATHVAAGGNLASYLIFFGVPVATYIVGVRRIAASVLCGAAFVLLGAWSASEYDSALESGSSTAALAWLRFPVSALPLVAAFIVIEQIVRAVRTRSATHSGRPSTKAG